MTELFKIWAPDDRPWSQWAKPVLFASGALPATAAPVPWPALDAPNDHSTALVIELPREHAVDYGIAAARDGYWPVPLFNCAFGPNCVLNVITLLERLAAATEELRKLSVPRQAPPAFLLDSRRLKPDVPLQPGNFDNRYVILPQDFPSAGFLKAHGISRAVWVRSSALAPSATVFTNTVPDDLAHVLRRWQEGGIEIYGTDLATHATERIDVPAPSRFRSLFYRVAALVGLRRNSAGGFGGIIPQPSSGG